MRCAIAVGVGLLDLLACRAFWIRRLHPAGAHCPACGISLAGRQSETFAHGGRVHCNNCRTWFSYRTATPLHGSTADDRQLYLLVLLLSTGTATALIAEACGLSADTVRKYRRLLGQESHQ